MTILLDIIKGGRYYKQLKYTKRGFPEIIEGKVTEVVDASDKGSLWKKACLPLPERIIA